MAESKLTSTDDLKPGDVLARDIMVGSTVLLRKNSSLTEKSISRIRKLGREAVYVVDTSGAGETREAEMAEQDTIRNISDIPQPNLRAFSNEDEPSWISSGTFSKKVPQPRDLSGVELLFAERKEEIRSSAGLRPVIDAGRETELVNNLHAAFINSAVKGNINLRKLNEISEQLHRELRSSDEASYMSFVDVPSYGHLLATNSISSIKLAGYRQLNQELQEADEVSVDFGEQIRAHLAINNTFTQLPEELLEQREASQNGQRERLSKILLIAYEWLRSQRFVSDDALEILMLRFERHDGNGIPYGLREDMIPNVSQAWSLSNHYSRHMYSSPGRERTSARTAAEQTVQESGRAFAGPNVNRFLRRVGYYPVGSLLELNDGSHGLVVGQHSNALMKPLLRRVTASGEPGEEIDLAKHTDLYVTRQILEY